MTDNIEKVEVEEKEKTQAEPAPQNVTAEPKTEAKAEEAPAKVAEEPKEAAKPATEPASEAAPKVEAKEEAKPTEPAATATTTTEPKEESSEPAKESSPTEEKPAAGEPVAEKAEATKEEPSEEKKEAKVEPNPLERSVEFKVPKDKVEAEKRKIIQQYGKTVRLDGFRKGKVPYSVLNEMYGPQAYQEALEKTINAELPAVLVPYGAVRVNQPNIQLVPSEDPDAPDFTFKATFEIQPDVELPDFKTLKVTKFECTLTDEDVENTIKVMQQQRTVYTDVDRPAKDGDKVTIDFAGKLNGESFPGGSHDNYSFILGNGQMLPDFEKEIPGMKPGDEKTFTMTFPSNYGNEELSGKDVEFTVKVKEVGDPKVPELDDEFAKAFQVEGGMAALRNDVRENLEREVKSRTLEKTKQSVLNALLAVANFPVPQSVVEDRRQAIVHNQVESLKARGMNVSADSIEPTAYLEQAKTAVKLGYLVNKIVTENGIFATEEQIKALAEDISKSFEDPREVVKWYLTNKDRKNELAGVVTETNAVNWVIDNADTQKQIISFKDLMAQQRVI